VCGWQDTGEYGPDLDTAAYNAVDIETARRTFGECGACQPELLTMVRAPLPGEERPNWWAPREAWVERVVQSLGRAFAGVTLAGGVSLREANDIDDYAMPSRDERSAAPAGYGDKVPWEQLGEAALSECSWGPFVFMDARGLRYYTPAFASWGLTRARTPNTPEFLLGALGYKRAACCRLFTAEQRLATTEWMFWLAREPVGWLAADALRALAEGWDEELDSERRELLKGRY